MAKKRLTRTHSILAVAVAVLLLALILIVIFRLLPETAAPEVHTGNPQTAVQHPIAIDPDLQNMGQPQTPEQVKGSEIPGYRDLDCVPATELSNGLSIVRSGSYTGSFVEDGSNAPCENVLALVVTNNSDTFLEWAEIAVPVGDKTAYFKLSSLPVGQSLLVLEKTAMVYDPADTCGQAVLLSNSLGSKEFSLHRDVFSITAADHVINLTNRSPQAISGNLAVYYKNASGGIYIGGITYVKTLPGGVAAGGVAQFICENYTVAGSEILFIVYEQ
ncbi:MAG: hypothetical protein IJA48_08960 [Oscillospiraceae bacterium]|nr:hypothetical protein [Oscillospiraceae bacterium]